jgi:hypothetical protein
MISRTNETPMMEAITIMKTAGRLLSKIELTTVVVSTTLALVPTAAGGIAGAEGRTATGLVAISCRALVAFVNPAVAFSKAIVAFPSVLVRFFVAAPVVFAALAESPRTVAVAADDFELLTLPAGKENEVLVEASLLSMKEIESK